MEEDNPQAPPQFNFFYRYGGQKEGDAALELYLSMDEMLLLGRFTPPKDQGRMLVADEVEASLMTLGIAHGIQNRTLAEAVFQCNINRKVLNDVILARGTQPKKTVPAYLRLEARLFAGAFPQESSLANVDMKSYSKIVVVKKGELLARAVHSQPGTNGFTVKGDPIPFGKKDVKFLKPGAHTLFSRGKVFARHSGRFVVTKDTFDVLNTLEVEGDVDYSVGHIIFPGDVTVNGIVLDGFHLVVGGNLTMKGPLDASEVMVKRDLHCGGGIFGNGPALVRVGGETHCSFIENCHLESLGTLNAGKEILNAQVYTNGGIKFADGGKIVNSTVWSKGSIWVSRIGNSSTRSHVVLGMDFVIHRKIERLRVLYREEEDKLLKIRGRLETVVQPNQNIQDVETGIQAEMDRLVQEINALQPQLIQTEDCRLAVKGEVWPGTVIEMGYARMDINEMQVGKTYRLNPDLRTISVEKYTPPEAE